MPSIDKKYYHNIDLAKNELKAGRIYNLTGNYINNYLNLTGNDTGYIVYNTTDYKLQFWDGSDWQILLSGLAGTVTSVSAGTGMSFTTITTTGSISIDTTKVPYLSGGFSTGFLKWNGSSWTFDNTSYLANSMSTNKLIGRSSAGTGVMEEISVGTGLTLSGGTLSATATGVPSGIASGTNTYSVTISGVTSPYTDGAAYLIRFTNGNDASGPTLNINSAGAITLYRNNDGQLLGGDIADGAEMLCTYNASNTTFQCIGISPNSLIAYVTNADSVTIYKGQPVYASGGTGDRMTVKLAYNTSDATSAQTVGLVMSTSIAANQKGFIMMQGLLDGLDNVKPANGWSDGSAVYLGSTAGIGGITPTKPYAPNHLVYIGFVTTASPGSAGRIYVRVQNGYELDELHNVQAQSPTTNDVLYYFGGNQWKTASISTILGYTPIQLTSLTASSPLSYNNLTGAFSIQDAAADGSTKGAATFTASDFNSASGVISIDYTNGQSASSSTKGFLTSTDWSTFNSKEPALTKGNLTESTSSVLTITGGSGSVIGTGTTIQVKQASGTESGFLSSTDWTTFNNKQNVLTNPITGTGTNNELAYFNTTGSTIASLSTTTYPSLTELSYVKGVTSSIQTQLNAKQGSLTLTTTGTSGAASLVGNTLNIPQYSGGGGGVTLDDVVALAVAL